LALLTAGAWAADNSPARSLAAPTVQSRSLAGLVVQFGDGTVREFCVDLGGQERSGIDLLRGSGLDFITEDTALGSMVCKIGDDGCGFPAEKCGCRCQDLGADCTYWAYHTLAQGRWDYASAGPSSRVVRHGDADGWAWGRGTVSGGLAPPPRTFASICAAALAPTAAPAVSPTARPSPTPPAPRRTAPPERPEPTAAGATSAAPATAPPRLSVPAPVSTAGSASGTGRTAPPPASETADPMAAARRATLAAFPTALAAFATSQARAYATALAAAGGSSISATGSAGGSPSAGDGRAVPATETPLAANLPAAVEDAADGVSGSGAVGLRTQVPPSADGTSASAPADLGASGSGAESSGRGAMDPPGASRTGYFVFLVAMLALAAAWLKLRRAG